MAHYEDLTGKRFGRLVVKERIFQNNNRRSSRYLTYNGETHSIAEWGRAFGIRPELIFDRLKKGWPLKDVLSNNKYGPYEHKRKG